MLAEKDTLFHYIHSIFNISFMIVGDIRYDEKKCRLLRSFVE
jgi:hypothetical protein